MSIEEKRMYTVLTTLALAVLALGTVFYHIVEGFAWIDAFYFSVITLTTVGYGDFSPATVLGKLFTTVYVLGGVGIMTTFITFFLKKQQERVHNRAVAKGRIKPEE